jgi:hypothetical protein
MVVARGREDGERLHLLNVGDERLKRRADAEILKFVLHVNCTYTAACTQRASDTTWPQAAHLKEAAAAVTSAPLPPADASPSTPRGH